MARRSLRFVGTRQLDFVESPIPEPSAGEVRVKTLVSAISPGTELLVYRGDAPTDLVADEAISSLSTSLSYPLRYGYAAVGRVTAIGTGVDDEWLDRLVFAFNPHETHFLATPGELHPVPDGIDPERAALVPSVETAVNLVLDGAPRIGERVAVFGQGLVGLLTTALLSPFPLAKLTTVDGLADRRRRSKALGADASVSPDELGTVHDRPPTGETSGTDLTYELSGNPDALDDAISVTGYDGRVVIGSWYGTKRVDVDLGGRFHRSRIELISSQVSTVDPSLRGRWDAERRFDVSWERLTALDLDHLVTHRYPFDDARTAYERLDDAPNETVGILFSYAE
ncbi:zinc-dependent alcohol dehydrogenase [Haloferacaceae archaeon DSL9]